MSPETPPRSGSRLPLGRWNVPHLGAKGNDVGLGVFEMHAFGRGRLSGARDARPPLALRPDRPLLETAPAIRADVVQMHFDASGTERALIGADTGIGRVGWQILIAPFAIGSEFEHLLQET